MLSAASIWGTILRYGGPLFFVFEALATLIVVQVRNIQIVGYQREAFIDTLVPEHGAPSQ